MKTFMLCAMIALPLAAPAFADCPAGADQSDEMARLLAQVQAAPTEGASRRYSQGMWEIWLDAPDARAQDMLDRGLRATRSYDFATAYDYFTQLITYCPDYAEGYNQRAFVNFLRKDHAAALVDLDVAIDLNPTHVAAIAGRALTLMGLGRTEEGQQTLRAALDLNPWLSERRLLIEPEGEDL